MTQIQESLNVISPETISPRLNKYLTQIDRLNIPQYVQLEEEAQQNIKSITSINTSNDDATINDANKSSINSNSSISSI